MGRPPRIHYPGAIFHVLTRGNARQDIFLQDSDYHRLLLLLVKEKERSPFELFAYCLMPNHLHLLIRVAKHPLRTIMRRVLGRYARYLNWRCKRSGHVFGSRYKTLHCADDIYLRELLRYIHLNPVRAGLCSTPEKWPWSSHAHYLGLREESFVDSSFLLSMFANDVEKARQLYGDFVLEGRDAPPPFFAPPRPALTYDPLPKGARESDLTALATRIEERRGLGKEILRAPCRRREVTSARKEFALAAYACGFGPGEIAVFLNRSGSAVCQMLSSQTTSIT